VVVGTSYDTAAIYHTVQITNASGSDTTGVCWRNTYDWMMTAGGSTHDDPRNGVELSNGSQVVATTDREFSYTPSTDDLVRVSYPGASYQPLLTLGYDPHLLPDLPTTRPDKYAMGWWSNVYDNSPFDYTVDPAHTPPFDTVGLSWFGHDEASAYVLGPGESVRFTQVLFATVPEPSTLVLLGTCIVGLLAYAWRRGK
jgi:hypothetical protein